MKMTAVQTSVRILSSVIYVIVASLITIVLSKWMNSDETTASTFAQTVKGLVSHPTGISLQDVGGHSSIKDELRASVLLPMQRPGIFYGGPRAIRPPRGILLHGPPGTGKTMLARAIACESGVPLITLHSAALESKWWGESPKLLQAVFHEARTTYAPCIIFFDEIDGLGRTRNEQDQSCVYSFKCELLRNMDSIDDSAVVVIACTNSVTSIDPALKRRFQRVLRVGKPSAEERRDVLKVITRDENDTVLCSNVAERTHDYTGADMSSLYEEASSIRMRTTHIPWNRIRSGNDLVRRIGPLTLEHWEQAAINAGKPLSTPQAELATKPQQDHG